MKYEEGASRPFGRHKTNRGNRIAVLESNIKNYPDYHRYKIEKSCHLIKYDMIYIYFVALHAKIEYFAFT